MLSNENVKELLAFPNQSEPVISLYLNADPMEGSADVYKLRLRNMLKGISPTKDVQAIEHYFNLEYDWSGRSVVVFSCSASDFFRAYPLALPVKDMIQVSQQPVVQPLIRLLDSFGGYGVVLVDKQGARLFHFNLGELKEQEGVVGDEVKRTKRGGASTMPGHRGGIAGRTRAMDETIDRNMRDAVEFAVDFFEEKRIRRIILCGSDDNIALFKSFLPKAWQSLVIGTFAMGMDASHQDVMEKAIQVGYDSENKRKQKIIEALVTATSKGENAVSGIEQTLEAVQANRVKTLVVTEGYHVSGYHCAQCGYLSVKTIRDCPNCISQLEPVNDVIEYAITAVLKSGGDIEFVPESTDLNRVGGIGAILRY